MCYLEHGDFLLDSRVESSCLQCISDSLRMDRMCESGIDEIGSLNCIIKLSRVDLSNNGLLVMSRELGRMATRIVFFVGIHLLTNSSDGTHANTSVIMNSMMGIALF